MIVEKSDSLGDTQLSLVKTLPICASFAMVHVSYLTVVSRHLSEVFTVLLYLVDTVSLESFITSGS